MSFRDLETGSHNGNSHAGKAAPVRQRHNQDCSFERCIKANVHEMRSNIRTIGEQLDRAEKAGLSQKSAQQVEAALESCKTLSRNTESSFLEWTVHFTGEPVERHRKKFAYEQLRKAFGDEEALLLATSNRAQRMLHEFKHCSEVTQHCSEGSSSDAEGEDASEDEAHEQQVLLAHRVAMEREEGILRIQSQVSEVGAIFRELAGLVVEQGQQFESIEAAVSDASVNTSKATDELKRSMQRQRRSQERLYCLLFAVLICLIFAIFSLGIPRASFSLPSLSPMTKPISSGPELLVIGTGVSKMK